jgi:hypothetical protein
MEQLRFPRPAEEASAECRHAWIADRIHKLADSFAVSVYAHAVMSNHFHVVLRSDPRVPWQWSDREVAERWLAIFLGSISDRDDPACVERATLALLGNAERLDVIRQRLGSISWFMRALNEPIARMANWWSWFWFPGFWFFLQPRHRRRRDRARAGST